MKYDYKIKPVNNLKTKNQIKKNHFSQIQKKAKMLSVGIYLLIIIITVVIMLILMNIIKF